MKKFKILIPVFNDWESLTKLLEEINFSIKDITGCIFECLIVNDASNIKPPKITVPKKINLIQIINMKENRGHARCNAHGLRYLSNNEKFDHLIIMDGDGEDRPEEIKLLVNKALLNEKISIVANRIKRSEGFFFKSLYQIHKILTLLSTGQKISFGNYCCLTFNDTKFLSKQSSIWSSFSGSLKKHIKILDEIKSIRGKRYFGPSKMSLFNLGIHSLSIIAVFKNIVFIRSAFLIIALSFFSSQHASLTMIIQILLVIFNLIIFLVSKRENQDSLNDSNLNQISTYTYKH